MSPVSNDGCARRSSSAAASCRRHPTASRKARNRRRWYWFSINGDDARPPFAFPGVWTRYKGSLKKNGETVEQEAFAFMTMEPNELTASINHERMPVLLTDPADFETWLSGWRAAMLPIRCGSCSRAQSARISWPHDLGSVAQLDRARDFESRGCRFESCRDRQSQLCGD
jgi:SOS response associated peptidase (SRAP)